MRRSTSMTASAAALLGALLWVVTPLPVAGVRLRVSSGVGARRAAPPSSPFAGTDLMSGGSGGGVRAAVPVTGRTAGAEVCMLLDCDEVVDQLSHDFHDSGTRCTADSPANDLLFRGVKDLLKGLPVNPECATANKAVEAARQAESELLKGHKEVLKQLKVVAKQKEQAAKVVEEVAKQAEKAAKEAEKAAKEAEKAAKEAEKDAEKAEEEATDDQRAAMAAERKKAARATEEAQLAVEAAKLEVERVKEDLQRIKEGSKAEADRLKEEANAAEEEADELLRPTKAAARAAVKAAEAVKAATCTHCCASAAAQKDLMHRMVGLAEASAAAAHPMSWCQALYAPSGGFSFGGYFLSRATVGDGAAPGGQVEGAPALTPMDVDVADGGRWVAPGGPAAPAALASGAPAAVAGESQLAETGVAPVAEAAARVTIDLGPLNCCGDTFEWLNAEDSERPCCSNYCEHIADRYLGFFTITACCSDPFMWAKGLCSAT